MFSLDLIYIEVFAAYLSSMNMLLHGRQEGVFVLGGRSSVRQDNQDMSCGIKAICRRTSQIRCMSSLAVQKVTNELKRRQRSIRGREQCSGRLLQPKSERVSIVAPKKLTVVCAEEVQDPAGKC